MSKAEAPRNGAPYAARAFTPAHGDLARSAGTAARLADEAYVEAMARIVYYWAYPAIDVLSRTSQWETMKAGPGLMVSHWLVRESTSIAG